MSNATKSNSARKSLIRRGNRTLRPQIVNLAAEGHATPFFETRGGTPAFAAIARARPLSPCIFRVQGVSLDRARRSQKIAKQSATVALGSGSGS